ncbi:AraC family transcriptional regulator [Dokdonia sp.]|uniref:helix-turn-helix domain-containing protein n=1 Tax=Dokdonia sp. TaxID=2024995 RepID=UPI003264DA29
MKKEKVLSVISISQHIVSSLFDRPNFYGIFFFTKANGTIKLDGRDIIIKTHNVFFYYPYQIIELYGDFEGELIQFHPDFFCIDIHAKDIGCQGLLFNNFFNDTNVKCSNTEFYELKQFCISILEELQYKRIGQLDMVASHLKMLLIQAVRIKKEKQEQQQISKDKIYHQIEVLLDKHFSSQSSPEFYIEQLEVSQTTFNRLCKKHFKHSFITLLNLKRVASAKNKLFLTNLPIKDIAYQIGYNDPLYFSRVFKKYCGISPIEFRKQLHHNRLI